ncbi:MAG TPA: cation:proton antiporter [candidate division WOR-3 bacterium]|uniref:Cation:proton antiporter n=1 Tax=candidate division WOR-3 bacterium TaxID=2052148 RepID=A0A7C5HNJ8_UNCW3|nr:cation:proton antiporter [candidate division WOR-3 bacterium]
MIINILFGVIVLATFLSLIRAIIGPTASDRMVAVDIMTTITTVVLVVLSLMFKRKIYLDVALVYAVLAYITTLVVARYLEKGI